MYLPDMVMKICVTTFIVSFSNIEKCSSPIGDGNFEKVLFASLQVTIEKCSSPIGDGNSECFGGATSTEALRNVAPR